MIDCRPLSFINPQHACARGLQYLLSHNLGDDLSPLNLENRSYFGERVSGTAYDSGCRLWLSIFKNRKLKYEFDTQSSRKEIKGLSEGQI